MLRLRDGGTDFAAFTMPSPTPAAEALVFVWMPIIKC